MAKITTTTKEVEDFVASFRTEADFEPSQATRNSYKHSLNLFVDYVHNVNMTQCIVSCVAYKQALLLRGAAAHILFSSIYST